MQIFELHFNPKNKEEQSFDSFAYEPTNSYEKTLGSLFMVGEVANTLPTNPNLLANLSEAIKKKYYALSSKTQKKAIAEALKEGNAFLSEEIKKENVNWLGNLNFSVFSLKDFNLNFTSTGSLKIFLVRGGQINDIGKNIDSKEIEPYPLKIFFNVVSGKLMENDVLVVMTENVFEFLNERKILEKISKSGGINEKKLKDIFPEKLFEENTSGVCFVVSLEENEEKTNPYQKAKEIIFEKPKDSFLSGISKKAGKINLPFKGISIKNKPNNNLILIAGFIILLFIGFMMFKSDIEIKQNGNIEKIEEKLKQGENLINSKKEQEANIVLIQALDEIKPLLKDKKSSFYEKANELKISIEENLAVVNKIEKIENPKSYISLNPDNIGFLAQNISFLNSRFYFSSPVSNDLYAFEKDSGEKTKGTYGLELDDDSSDFVLFFSKPNRISYLYENEIKEENIEVSDSFNFRSFCSFNSSLYFLNSDKNEILKYPYAGNLKWKAPENAITPESKTKSITIDGFIWTLNEKNEIEGYYKGEQKKKIILNIYPAPKNFTRIMTKIELPYIYISEPINNRIIVIDKDGNLIKQFYSEDFSNIKDFAVSPNGNTIWLLNATDVYELNL